MLISHLHHGSTENIHTGDAHFRAPRGGKALYQVFARCRRKRRLLRGRARQSYRRGNHRVGAEQYAMSLKSVADMIAIRSAVDRLIRQHHGTTNRLQESCRDHSAFGACNQNFSCRPSDAEQRGLGLRRRRKEVINRSQKQPVKTMPKLCTSLISLPGPPSRGRVWGS